MPQKRTIPRTCEQCGDAFLAPAGNVKKGKGRFCSRPCRETHRKAQSLIRFWDKVDQTGDCWEWQGAFFKQSGYGMVGFESLGTISAHRVAWTLTNGPIENGLQVLHQCDNRKCCNPAHLFLGTQADNMDDMVHKGRQAVGERGGNAKLTEDQVREIRRMYAAGIENTYQLAETFGVSRPTIGAIIHRRIWKHVS